MNKEEWAQVEKALSGLVGQVKLLVDGRTVTFQRYCHKNRLAIGTWIDGTFKGAWCSTKEPVPESRYFRPVAKFAWPADARRKMKSISKKDLKKMGWDPAEKYHGFSPSWPNATAIRRHYQKTFASIELLSARGWQP